MPKILQTLAEVNNGQIEGYMILSEIPATNDQEKNAPISLRDIEAALQK
jgi:hypothetical protein